MPPQTQGRRSALDFDPEDCPIRDVLSRLGDRWSLLVLETLNSRVLRFNELRREIADVSKQMLAQTLRRLERDGLVERTVYAEIPPRVEYQLTPLGYSLLLPVQSLVEWAETNHNTIRSARQGYDVTERP